MYCQMAPIFKTDIQLKNMSKTAFSENLSEINPVVVEIRRSEVGLLVLSALHSVAC